MFRIQSLINEYLEMVLQFGFVTIFVAAFPLAPLFALINNALEIRLDARKMVTAFRRPVARRVKDIGAWLRIMDFISKLAVLSNGVIIAFTSDFIPRSIYYANNGDLRGYLNSTVSPFEISKLRSMYYNRTELDRLELDGHKLCYYQGKRTSPLSSDPYEPNVNYWQEMAYKIAFVFVFQNVIGTLTMLLRLFIPDVPATLRQNIREQQYLTNQLIMKHELKRGSKVARKFTL